METTSLVSDAGEGEDLEFKVELEEETLLSDQLGNQSYYDNEEEKTGSPREVVNRKETSGKNILFHV